MMIKVGDEYLDYDGEIEIERQAKLFSDLQTTNGDYSYSFELPTTSNNLKVLGLPIPDIKNKSIYRRIEANILSDHGDTLYYGYLRIENVKEFISVSFFSGNNNWFSLLAGNLDDIDLSAYDEDITPTIINQSWSRTSGIIYQLADFGTIQNRSHNIFTIPDFVPSMFVHTAMNEIFKSSGLKISGDLINDADYKKATITSTRVDENELTIRTVYANKTADQVIPSSVDTQIIFDDVSTSPFYDATNGNYASSSYTADVDMIVTIELRIIKTTSALNFVFLKIFINGLLYQQYTDTRTRVNVDEENIRLKASDIVTIQFYSDIGTETINAGSTLKIIPTRVYITNGSIVLPNWTKQEFVSNVLRLYNVIPTYDPFSKTVYFDLFEKIKSKEPIDLSEYVVTQEFNYTDVVSEYAKINKLNYTEANITEIENYNKSNTTQYATGIVNIDNEHIEEEKDIIDSNFATPYGYINTVFDMHFEKLTLNDFESINNIDITQVDDFGGTAQFKMGTTTHKIRVGDIVRISDSTNNSYDGEWVVSYATDDNVRLYGVDYQGDANMNIELLVIKRSNTDDSFIMLNSGLMTLSEFTDETEINIFTTSNNTYTSASFAYFNLLNTGRSANDILLSGLSFGTINNLNSYQTTLLETRFNLFRLILQDPVKNLSTMIIPDHIFKQIDFTRPIFIKTDQTSNLYYADRILGYINSYSPCNVDLIKLP